MTIMASGFTFNTSSISPIVKKIRTLEELNYYWSIYLEKYYHNRSHEGIREYYRSLGVSVSEVVRLVSDPIKILKGKKEV